MAVLPISLSIKKTLSGNREINLLQKLKKDNWWAIKAYIYTASIYYTRTGLFNQAVLPLISQEPSLLHQLVKKKVATIISTRYHLRNFILRTLH